MSQAEVCSAIRFRLNALKRRRDGLKFWPLGIVALMAASAVQRYFSEGRVPWSGHPDLTDIMIGTTGLVAIICTSLAESVMNGIIELAEIELLKALELADQERAKTLR